MRECVRELCILSIFCGAILSLAPEGGAKRILRILETAVLLSVLLNGIGKLDLGPYTLEMARLHEMERQLASDTEDMQNRLNRLVIEEEYSSYVKERAKSLGLNPQEVHIQARWSREGLWIPDSSRIRLTSEHGRAELSQILLGELGIPRERQEWIADG